MPTPDAGWGPDEDTNPRGRPPAAPAADLAPDGDDEGTDQWLFREADDQTALHYHGLRDPNQTTEPSTIARPQPSSAPLGPPASAQLPPMPVPPPPVSAAPGDPWVASTLAPTAARSPVGTSIVVGTAIGIAVLAIAAVAVWWLQQQPLHTTVPSLTPVSSVSPTPSSTPKPSPTASASATPTASASATPTASVAPANDPANTQGWTYIIDGLGPVKVGMSATDAAKLGIVAATTDACGYGPTAALGEVKVYVANSRVHSIDIRSAAFPSGRGIKVGAALAELQAAYGSSLKTVPMSNAGAEILGFALVNKSQYIAYLTEGDVVTRIVIGARGSGGSISLPPPTC